MRHRVIAAGLAATLALGFTAVAPAADIATRPPVTKAPPMAAPYNWTGFYIGAHIGGGWGEKDWVAVGVGPLGSHDVDGFLGGGQVGMNYQVGRWVFGVEADFSWADLTGNHVTTCFSAITARRSNGSAR